MPRIIESLFLPGPGGRLEALLEEPEEGAPRGAALVCHPHPQHGGTMHNKVVFRVAKGLRRAGFVVLRFNYRGVNQSEGTYDHGRGETDDARAALSYLKSRYLQLPFMLAGFSFGSRIVLQLGCEPPTPERVIAVGFPTVYTDRSYLAACQVPRVFVQSTRDEYGPIAELSPLVESMAGANTLRQIEAQDHFFSGALEELEQTIWEIAR